MGSRADHRICERPNRQARGLHAQAPVAEFGDKIMCLQRAPAIVHRKRMQHYSDFRKRIRARMEEHEEGREGLKREEQRQDRHFEKAVMRSADGDPELRRPEEEHTRTWWRSKTTMVKEETKEKEKRQRGTKTTKQIKYCTARMMTREAQKEKQKTKENVRRQRDKTISSRVACVKRS